jgi:hypothetical protein
MFMVAAMIRHCGGSVGKPVGRLDARKAGRQGRGIRAERRRLVAECPLLSIFN